MRNTPRIIAHRGARAHAPENTLFAAELAYSLGADMWEMDTAVTCDGHLVVVHDDTLERTTDVAVRPEFAARAPWPVGAFTLAEIRSLDAGSWFCETDPFGTIAAGEIAKDRLVSFCGAQIPTLEEVLLLTRDYGWQVNVEIKSHAGLPGHTTIAGKVAACIQRLGMTDSVIISSFQHLYLRECAALLPSVRLGALVERPAAGEDVTAGTKAGTAMLPTLDAATAISLCRESGAHFFHPDKSFLDADLVRDVQAAGYGVAVWTVNTPEDMQRIAGYGVQGIFTDFPARLADLVGK